VAELVDYSGKFDPEFSYDKLSKETLLKLLEGYAGYMLRIDAYWYLTVMDKWGNDEALDCDRRVWLEGKKLSLYEAKTISSLLNIHGDDVTTVMKYVQSCPGSWFQDYEIDIKSNNHAILTFLTCPTLFAIEKEGTGREGLICQIDSQYWSTVAHYFNPNIEVNGLKVPPRTNYSDICCRWEFKLNSCHS